jgi:hypothetical protein
MKNVVAMSPHGGRAISQINIRPADITFVFSNWWFFSWVDIGRIHI